jgi:hypothetical protein
MNAGACLLIAGAGRFTLVLAAIGMRHVPLAPSWPADDRAALIRAAGDMLEVAGEDCCTIARFDRMAQLVTNVHDRVARHDRDIWPVLRRRGCIADAVDLTAPVGWGADRVCAALLAGDRLTHRDRAALAADQCRVSRTIAAALDSARQGAAAACDDRAVTGALARLRRRLDALGVRLDDGAALSSLASRDGGARPLGGRERWPISVPATHA